MISKNLPVYCFLSFLALAGFAILFKAKAFQDFMAYGPEHNPLYKHDQWFIKWQKSKFRLYGIRIFGFALATFAGFMLYQIAINHEPVIWGGMH